MSLIPLLLRLARDSGSLTRLSALRWESIMELVGSQPGTLSAAVQRLLVA
jgi:hypothetical protein